MIFTEYMHAFVVRFPLVANPLPVFAGMICSIIILNMRLDVCLSICCQTTAGCYCIEEVETITACGWPQANP